MSIHSSIPAFDPCQFTIPPHFSSPLRGLLRSPIKTPWRRSFDFRCQSDDRREDYLLDAPVSVGDGFSFSGGKYSDGSSPADDWFKQGRMVKAYAVQSAGEKAKDPIFGLKMASSSQVSDDIFRWFCVESGSTDKPSVLLIHGFPSQAYSYRKVIPILAKDYHVIAFDWLGFGFSEKPQPKYGFDYTMEEYVASLASLIDELSITKVSLVVQGYFSPVVVKYASNHQDKVNDLILLNPPQTMPTYPRRYPYLATFCWVRYFPRYQMSLETGKVVFRLVTHDPYRKTLPPTLHAMDPLRASDKALTSCGPYKMKEDDAMVYRRPYLTSGSSGFALNAISRSMKKQLKIYMDEMTRILMDSSWGVKTTVCWGQRDRWLSFEGVEEFCKSSKHKLIELPAAGHHVQEDSGAELGEILTGIISKRRRA